VAHAAGKRAAEVDAVVLDLGDRVGVLRPIAVAGVCTKCHGAINSMDPAVSRTLASSYPDDQAVGFAEGDLRGFFWAEAPKR
jgi:hypothetical protein